MKITVLRSSSGNSQSAIRIPKFLVFFSALLFALSVSAQAQQTKKIPRVGYLAGSDADPSPAFLQGLRELGYVEGKNIIVEFRSAQGKLASLPELATELIHVNVDVVLAGGPNAARAIQRLTSTIPIVA